jgi:HEAT repeat protein
MSSTDPSPLDRLLKLGAEPARRRTWPNYLSLGLEDRHVPALIRMAVDPALHATAARDAKAWAPLHAWRALGQLRAPDAAGPLILLLQREMDRWVLDEIPAVLGMIGPPSLRGATMLLFDEGMDEEVRIAMADAIVAVAFHHPDRRDEAAAVLAKQLEDWSRQSRRLNAYLVSDLVDLQAKEAAPLMEAAYAAGAVDVDFMGDWEDVQVDFGLIPERTTPYPAFQPAPGSGQAARRAAADARRRRKAEKLARKRNRKKK